MSNVTPIRPDSVVHLPLVRMNPPADYPTGIRFVDQPRPTVTDRIAYFIESPFAAGMYVGIYIGMMLTVAAALVVAFL